jgi:ribose 5-phosphate isomerase B
MKVFFASDHAGFDLKKALVAYVQTLGYEVEDLGAHEYAPDDDYPDYVAAAAMRVSKDPEHTRAIVIGGSGQGEAIVANRFAQVRAAVYNGESRGALYNDLDEITLSREHNNANILSLGARFLTEEEAQNAVQRWLTTVWSGDDRHARRIARIEEITKEQVQ